MKEIFRMIRYFDFNISDFLGIRSEISHLSQFLFRVSYADFKIPTNKNQLIKLNANVIDWLIDYHGIHQAKFDPFFEKPIEITVSKLS